MLYLKSKDMNEKKEVYVVPEVRVVMLELEGVIACSKEICAEGDTWGGSVEW